MAGFKTSNSGSNKTRLSRFASAREGATALEFAIVSIPFLLMVFFITEFGIYSFHKQYLKHVLYEASRNLQTGEIQETTSALFYFEKEICSDAALMFECDKVYFDVRAFDSIDKVVLPDLVFDQSGKPTNTVFQPGIGSQYIAVRLTTTFDFFTPLLTKIFQPNGDPVITVGVSIARNEPFSL